MLAVLESSIDGLKRPVTIQHVTVKWHHRSKGEQQVRNHRVPEIMNKKEGNNCRHSTADNGNRTEQEEVGHGHDDSKTLPARWAGVIAMV